ncbi:hypothetical protein Tco_1006134 [Tanacetum coccineum]|uniref:CCHC-type domain-containing protein n=1 Tax=Tanacetum coccineum TaxID=301880 RepID=A0ABQ5FGQ4_9ASTR
MASFDYRLNPLYAIKECSSCGTLCTRDCGCSKGGLEDKILVPIPDLSRRPLKIEKICLDCGDPVHGLYCRQCALIRKTLEEVFQDFQDTSKSSDDDTNFVNQEPFVVKQGPGVNSSQSPPQINHNCCYECGDSLDDIFCQRCTCKSCGKGAHYGYNCPPQIPIISNPKPCYNQNLNEILQNLQSLQQQCLFGTCQQCGCNEYDGQKKEEEKRIAEEQAAKDRYWKILVCYDDDDDEESSIPLKDFISELPPCVAITPDSPKTNSLIMEDEHLDTILKTESDELIKYSVKDLVQIPSESEDSFEEITSTKVDQIDDEVLENTNLIPPGIEYLCFNAKSDLLESLLDTLINDSQKIDSLLDEFAGELTLFKSILPGIDDDNLDPEGEIHLNPIYLLSPVEDRTLLRREIDIFLDGDDSIPPGIESDDFDSEDDDNYTSRPEFESFHVDYPGLGDSTIDVVEDIPVDVPNILPTHPALLMDFDFIPSNDLRSNLDDSSPSGDSNKIYDPGICIKVESTKILASKEKSRIAGQRLATPY